MLRSTLAALALSLGFAGAALAGEKCTAPETSWQPQEALKQKLEGEGWKISRMKVEDGCYEVYAIDDKGKKVEAFFDPQTFVLMASEED